MDQVWEYSSDNSWLPSVVSLGSEGTQVFMEIGSFNNSRLLFSAHDQHPPTPVWQVDDSTVHYRQDVDSAAMGEVHAVLFHEPGSLPGSQRAVVQKFHSSSDSALWEYVFTPNVSGQQSTTVRVSASGQRVVGAVFDSASFTTQVAVFDTDTGSPSAVHDVWTLGPSRAIELSGDGSTLALQSDNKLMVVDLDSGQVLHQSYPGMSSFYGALSISDDGDRVAARGANKVLVLDRQGSSYGTALQVTLGANEICDGLALSGDGSRLAYGFNDATQPTQGRILWMDVDSQQVLLDYTQSGSGSETNIVDHLDLSSDGSRLAVGLWGDGSAGSPEVLVFEEGTGSPVRWFDAPGTVLAMDLSPDGRSLAVGARQGHASVFGGGGGYFLLDTCDTDFDLHGAPQIGATVTFSQQHEAEAYGVVLSAPQLASEPLVFPGVGSLLLDAGSLSVLPSIVPTDGEGVAYVPHQIPNQASLVGTTSYYQGFGLRPRKLSEDYVRVTVLP